MTIRRPRPAAPSVYPDVGAALMFIGDAILDLAEATREQTQAVVDAQNAESERSRQATDENLARVERAVVARQGALRREREATTGEGPSAESCGDAISVPSPAGDLETVRCTLLKGHPGEWHAGYGSGVGPPHRWRSAPSPTTESDYA